MGFGSPPFRRTRSGAYRVHLSAQERGLLRGLAVELAAELGDPGDDPALGRLFPHAYDADDKAEAEYRELLGDALRDQRSRELGVLAATSEHDELSAEELHAWLTALNDLRLVLGTRLGVTEDLYERLDPREPPPQDLGIYLYLTWLQEQLVDAAPLDPGA
jgi:Domain of unknown function (DUF2017)